MATKAQPKRKTNTAKVAYLRMSPVKLALLLFFTFGIYDLYWFYKNWQAVKEATGEKLSPFWRAIFSGIWVWSLFPRIFKNKKGLALSLSAIYLGSSLVSFMVSKLDAQYNLIAAISTFALIVVGLVPLVIAQNTINRGSKSLKATKRKVGKGEVALIILGVVVFAATVYTFAVPDTSMTRTAEQTSLKTQVDDLTKQYDECSAALSVRQASIDPGNKEAVDAYNKDFDACETVRKQQNDAVDAYNESTAE